jgi:hypothetical protein
MSTAIDEYINKQNSPQKEICEKLRELIFRTFPDVKQEIKWGVPAFAEGKFYIVALKDHVNLGFSIQGLTRKEVGLFDGGGKTTKHIQVNSIEGIDEERIVTLINLIEKRTGGQ